MIIYIKINTKDLNPFQTCFNDEKIILIVTEDDEQSDRWPRLSRIGEQRLHVRDVTLHGQSMSRLPYVTGKWSLLLYPVRENKAKVI